MKKLTVTYTGWGERFPLALLADDGRALLFQYTPEALARGLELSPYHLELSRDAYGDFPMHQHRLPGLVSDALPDGWGMLLMDRLFRRNGINVATVSPLDRLAFIGEDAMGALAFEPPGAQRLEKRDVELLRIANGVRHVLAGNSEDMLRELALMGGSPHGARPKVRLTFDLASGAVSTAEDAPGTPWLVKFPGQGEDAEVCAIEYVYADMARRAGIPMPATHFFALAEDLTAFGIERFDRADGMRVPVHTVSGLAHADFRQPRIDYLSVLRLTRLLTADEREVLEMYRRCVFNVAFHNRDDHSKNLSFLMRRNGAWGVAPGYDLTFNEGPAGYHHMDVCGEAMRIEGSHLLDLASKAGLKRGDAMTVIDQVCEAASHFPSAARNMPIRKATWSHVSEKVAHSRGLVGRHP
ncbi:type II toxin-antitoxin system HipA family toxin [Burkholderia sp. Ac-20353]|uniref:type II toxin-antitoxin system HipA family toxin n=1 Tax=Burkholderia sp. Ac-20353 TaxID=2703894 RepID=UPI00197BE167|nr:type II toxin-antitoxin system HipA family toxin [Burkholderia sp. Ac-20353]MBN3792785.1 type II toxin-antitoxin system HipA family toxin [Burkholderia sp. Ac-20353]